MDYYSSFERTFDSIINIPEDKLSLRDKLIMEFKEYMTVLKMVLSGDKNIDVCFLNFVIIGYYSMIEEVEKEYGLFDRLKLIRGLEIIEDMIEELYDNVNFNNLKVISLKECQYELQQNMDKIEIQKRKAIEKLIKYGKSNE